MRSCLADLRPRADAGRELREVFRRVGANYESPNPVELDRVLTVLKVDALARGRDPAFVQAQVGQLHRLIEHFRRHGSE